jgi:hypothetical protein
VRNEYFEQIANKLDSGLSAEMKLWAQRLNLGKTNLHNHDNHQQSQNDESCSDSLNEDTNSNIRLKDHLYNDRNGSLITNANKSQNETINDIEEIQSTPPKRRVLKFNLENDDNLKPELV